MGENEYKLYTEWVDDNGDFDTGTNLLKPLNEDILYNKNDGLRTLNGKTITDLSIVKPGHTVKRKWPYLQNVYYRANVVRVKVDRGAKRQKLEESDQRNESSIETLAVKRLQQMLRECKAELDLVKRENEELKSKAQ